MCYFLISPAILGEEGETHHCSIFKISAEFFEPFQDGTQERFNRTQRLTIKRKKGGKKSLFIIRPNLCPPFKIRSIAMEQRRHPPLPEIKIAYYFIEFYKKTKKKVLSLGEHGVKDIKHSRGEKPDLWVLTMIKKQQENASVCLKKEGLESFQITPSSLIPHRDSFIIRWLPFSQRQLWKGQSLTFPHLLYLLLEPLLKHGDHLSSLNNPGLLLGKV